MSPLPLAPLSYGWVLLGHHLYLPACFCSCHWPQESGGLSWHLTLFNWEEPPCAGEVLSENIFHSHMLSVGSGAPWHHTAISNYWWSLENTLSSCKGIILNVSSVSNPGLWNLGFHQDFLAKLLSEEIIYWCLTYPFIISVLSELPPISDFRSSFQLFYVRGEEKNWVSSYRSPSFAEAIYICIFVSELLE